MGHRRRLVWHDRHRLQTTIHVPRRWNRSPLGDWRSQHQPRTSAAHATHGVWRYLGKGRFGVTMWDIFYDINTAQLIQYTKVRLEVTLGDDRDEASARARLDFIDPQGVVLSVGHGHHQLRAHPVRAARVGRDRDGQYCTSAWNLPVVAPAWSLSWGTAAASARRSWDCWRKLNDRRAMSIHIDTARRRSDVGSVSELCQIPPQTLVRLRTSSKICRTMSISSKLVRRPNETPNGAGSNKEADDAGYGVRENH